VIAYHLWNFYKLGIIIRFQDIYWKIMKKLFWDNYWKSMRYTDVATFLIYIAG